MKRLFKNQSGFTLVELLVVVGIIVALAAAIIPNISRFTGSGETAAADSELDTVQAAMDTAMADLGLTTVVAGTNVSDFSSTGSAYIDDPDGTPGNGDEVYLYPSYLRVASAGYGPYNWTTAGLVSRP